MHGCTLRKPESAPDSAAAVHVVKKIQWATCKKANVYVYIANRWRRALLLITCYMY